jgi:hypothetical protein
MGRPACTEPQCLYKGALYLVCVCVCVLDTDKCEKKKFVTMHKSMRPVGRSRYRWGDNIAMNRNEGGVTPYNTFKRLAVKEKAIRTEIEEWVRRRLHRDKPDPAGSRNSSCRSLRRVVSVRNVPGTFCTHTHTHTHTHSAFVFCVDLRTNSAYFPTQH